MKLNWFPVVFMPLVGGICVAEVIFESPGPDSELEVVKAAVSVVTSCYSNRGNAVGFGNFPGTLLKSLAFRHIPVVLVDNSTSIVIRKFGNQRTFTYKLQAFVATASIYLELEKMMHETENTMWWNHMVPILILCTRFHGCPVAQRLLFAAWNMDMLNAKVIFFNRQSGTRILGYNPYTSQAPYPWRHFHIFMVNNHPFTIVEQLHRDGEDICRNLETDKTTNLGGYSVDLFYESYVEYTHTGDGKYLIRYGHMTNNVLRSIFRVMNAAVIRSTVKSTVTKRFNANRLKDISYATGPMTRGLYLPVSRPFLEFGLIVMTQHTGHMSQLQKILSVIDQHSRVGLYVVIFVTMGFFKFIVGQSLMPGILNVIRIICNTGFTNLPPNTAPRLYRTSVLLFAVNMQGIYQGNLAAVLTTHVPLPTVNKYHDFAEFSHTIYVAAGNMIYFRNPRFEGSLMALNRSDECAKYVLSDPSVACVGTGWLLMSQAEELKLHLSSERIIAEFSVYKYRVQWPLEKRFDTMLTRLQEVDIIWSFYLRVNQTNFSDFSLDEDVRSNAEFRNMTLKDLIFAFVILGIGLVIASITFIFEIVIGRIRSKIGMRGIRFLNWLL